MFESSHFKKGKLERKLWKQFVTDDVAFGAGSETISLDINDIANFPKESDIKNVDSRALVNKKYKTEISIKRKYVEGYIDELIEAGYAIAELGDVIEITISGDHNKSSLGIEQVDSFLSKACEIHTSKDIGTYTVTLELPAEDIMAEQIIEGDVTLKKEVVAVACAVQKKLAAIALILAAKDYDEGKALRMYELFRAVNSKDTGRIYDVLFNAVDQKYNLPSHLVRIKNRYETALAQLMGGCTRKVSGLFEKLAGLLSSYETAINTANAPDNLHDEIKASKHNTLSTVLFYSLLTVLAVLDFGLNYYTFNAVLKDKYEFLLWITALGYGILLIIAARVYVFLCPDYKSILSLKSLVILIPLGVLLLSSGYLRYVFEAGKGASESLEQMSLDALAEPQGVQGYYNYVATALFLTTYSFFVFIIATLADYRHKFGTFTVFYNKYLCVKCDEKIKKCRKKILNVLDSYYNEKINHLIQSGQTEVAEYINGFEYPSDEKEETEADKRRFKDYLHWLKTKRVLEIEPGSQINEEHFFSHKDRITEKMHHYLRIRNKAIAFKTGFDDAVNAAPNNPRRIFGNPLFHKKEASIDAMMTEEDVDACLAAYNFGYSHGEKNK